MRKTAHGVGKSVQLFIRNRLNLLRHLELMASLKNGMQMATTSKSFECNHSKFPKQSMSVSSAINMPTTTIRPHRHSRVVFALSSCVPFPPPAAPLPLHFALCALLKLRLCSDAVHGKTLRISFNRLRSFIRFRYIFISLCNSLSYSHR